MAAPSISQILWASGGGAAKRDPTSKATTGWLGGVTPEAPYVEDFNGLLNNITDWLRWVKDEKTLDIQNSSGAITIGNSLATSVTIGRDASPTDINGKDITVGNGTADSVTIGNAGADIYILGNINIPTPTGLSYATVSSAAAYTSTPTNVSDFYSTSHIKQRVTSDDANAKVFMGAEYLGTSGGAGWVFGRTGATSATHADLYVNGAGGQGGLDTKVLSATSTGVSVTGNIAVTGTVDGIDIAGSINQGVKTTDTPDFSGIGINTDDVDGIMLQNSPMVGTKYTSGSIFEFYGTNVNSAAPGRIGMFGYNASNKPITFGVAQNSGNAFIALNAQSAGIPGSDQINRVVTGAALKCGDLDGTHWALSTGATAPANSAISWLSAVKINYATTDIELAGQLTAADVISAGPISDSRKYASLNAAITSIGAKKITLVIVDEFSVTGNVTVPENVTLSFARAGHLSSAAPYTVTCNCYIIADNHTIFDSSITINGNIKNEQIVPQWFGALADGTTDDSAAINKAIAAHHTVFLPAGTYATLSTIKIPSFEGAQRTLKGSGSKSSIIKHSRVSYLNTAECVVWVGNSTDDKAPAYQCKSPHLHDFGIVINAYSRVGLRVRGCISGTFERLHIGSAVVDAGYTDIKCLLVDGAIECKFDQLDLIAYSNYGVSVPAVQNAQICAAQTLLRTAGSGSGEGITSCGFYNCYFHYASTNITLSGGNNVKFYNCVIEACYHGVIIESSLLSEFHGCYMEGISKKTIQVLGVDSRNHACVSVIGGWHHFYNRSGLSGDPFIYAEYATKIRVTGMQMTGYHGVGRLIETVNTQQIEMDADPFSQHCAPNPTMMLSTTDPFSTTNGSGTLTVEWANHGFVVGNVVGFRGASTELDSPLFNLDLGYPFWRVSNVTGPDTFECTSLAKLRPVANSTQTGFGGSITLISYGPGVWCNCSITEPSKTKFLDCDHQELRFENDLTTSGTVALLLNKSMESYVCDTWTYILYSRRQRSVVYGSSFTNYCILRLDLPSGYAQDYYAFQTLKIPTGLAVGDSEDIALKVPPGTVIRMQHTSAAAPSPGENRTEVCTLYIAKTRIALLAEA